MMTKKKGFLGKYVSMCTDFGMKHYFGPKEGKQNLIHFLNSLFEGEKRITDLEYRPVEYAGERAQERKVVFDLYCTSADNSHFIVEMQQLSQEFFKDRTVYYTSKLIAKQLPRGVKGNSYELPEVYFIGILDFVLEASGSGQYFYDVALFDKQRQEQFYDKLGYKLLVLPAFRKTDAEISSVMDMWLYLFRYIEELNEMPKFLDKRVFQLIFDIGEVANLTTEDMNAYEVSLKNRRDAESVRLTAERIGEEKGILKGRQEGRLEERAKTKARILASARKMLQRGDSIEEVCDILGLSREEVEALA